MGSEPRLIRSRDNPEVKALLRIARSARERRATATTILDGERLIESFGASGGTAEVIAVTDAAYGTPRIRKLLEGVPARSRLLLADPLVRQISQVVTTNGVLAVVRIPKPSPVPGRLPSCLLLDGIQDPGNLGSILRSAAAAAIGHVFLSERSVFAWSPKVVRAGMGAHFHLSIYEGVDLKAIAERAAGPVIATGPHALQSLYDTDLRGQVAWIFGGEASGLSDEAVQMATHLVRIPMSGGIESLNVAAAAAVCIFEQLRQRFISQCERR